MGTTKNQKVIVAFKTHFDIGFTELFDEFLARMSDGMLRDAVIACENTKRELDQKYVWTMPSWPLMKTLELSSEDISQKAEELVRDGQIVAHGLPFTLHTETASIEDLLFATNYVDSLVKKYGIKAPISAKMTDVPGHTWFLVSALSLAGVKFLHLGCNPASMPADVPRLFWWEAPDGKRILTFYSKGCYGSSLTPPEDWEFPVWLALQQTNDNKGAHKVDEIKEMVSSLNGYDFSFGSLDDFYNEIIKYDLSSLPVIKQDLADSWIHGVGSYPKEVGTIRRARNKLNGVNRLNSLANHSDNARKRSVNEKIKEARESSLLFSEHTWGLSVIATLGPFRKYQKDEFIKQRTTLPYYNRIEKSWDDQRNFANTTANIANQTACDYGYENGSFVFNPNGHAYTGLMEVSKEQENSVTLNDRHYVYVENLPPLSCSELKPSQIEKVEYRDNGDFVEVSNAIIKLRVNKHTGLFDFYKNGVILLQNSGSYVYNIIGIEQVTEFVRDYIYRFYDWAIQDFARSAYPEIPSLSFSPKFDSLNYKDGKLTVCFKGDDVSVAKYGDAHGITVEYLLEGEKLHVGLKLHSKEASPYLESGNFIFNFVDNKHYLVNKTGTVISPEKDICDGCNRTYFCLEKYLETTNANPVRVFAKDSPLFAIGEDGCYKFNGKVNESSEVWFNLFNNMWGTNFPQWNEGDFTFDYTIDTNITSNKFDLMPLVTDTKTVKNIIGELPLGVELEGVTEKDGKLTVLLRETQGKVSVFDLNFNSSSAVECDFKGNAIGETSKTGKLKLTFEKYEVKAISIDF